MPSLSPAAEPGMVAFAPVSDEPLRHYRCTRCDIEFDSNEARCRKCLRKSTVRDLGAPRAVPAPAELPVVADPAPREPSGADPVPAPPADVVERPLAAARPQAPRPASPMVPAGPVGSSAAGRHLRINVWLAGAFAFVHLLGALAVIANLTLYLVGRGDPSFGYPIPEEPASRYAYFFTLGAAGVWSVVGIAWSPLNAFGLFRRRPWARTSARLYWALSFATLCLLPFAAYAIWSLSREDVGALFEAGSLRTHHDPPDPPDPPKSSALPRGPEPPERNAVTLLGP